MTATTYGTARRWHWLYMAVTGQERDLRGQLRALVQASHAGADPGDVQAVRAALFAAHDARPAL